MRKLAIVTGASSGIGEATTRLFAANDYHVLMLARNTQKLTKLEKELFPNAKAIVCDLSSSASIQSAAVGITAFDGSIEVLVNNAGIFSRHSIHETSMPTWLQMFQVNFFGAVELTQALIPRMKEQNRGSIVNIASTLGLKTTTGTSCYGASKAAMIHWTQSLAIELGQYNIRANCIAPGLVDTPIHNFHSLTEKEKAKTLTDLSQVQPLGRVGRAVEIAESILFLAGPKSAWTTGATLSVDGGINLV